MNKKNKVKVRRYKGYAITSEGEVYKSGNPYKCWKEQGYKQIWIDGEGREALHRVMAMLFSEQNVEGMHVHHLNGIKDDNRIENLVVLTAEEHASVHTTGRVLTKKQKEVRRMKSTKRRVEMEVNGKTARFESVREASRKIGVNSGHITECCQGKRDSAGKVKMPDGTEYKAAWRYI